MFQHCLKFGNNNGVLTTLNGPLATIVGALIALIGTPTLPIGASNIVGLNNVVNEGLLFFLV
jgi:hypothetical protein